MSELERLHQARLERERKAREERDKPDPTEWAPKGWRADWERADNNVSAETLRSQPLYYGSLVDKADGIAAIEATARADLIREMDRRGLYPDERGIRSQWVLVVEGHGFRMPEGFIHPEAPDDTKAEGRTRWKRVVEMASDSMTRVIFVKVWRRKASAPVLPGQPFAIEATGAPIDEVVDAEIVEED